MTNIKSLTTLFALLIFIGAPTFFTGCGTNIPNTCFIYTKAVGTVYGYQIKKDNCRKCINYNNNKCTQYTNYDCFDGYVKFSYRDVNSNNNSTCKVHAYNDQTFATDVSTLLHTNYPDGSKQEIYVRKDGNNNCNLRGDITAQTRTYVGLIFLGFSGILLLCIIYLTTKYLIEKNNSRIIPVSKYYTDNDMEKPVDIDTKIRKTQELMSMVEQLYHPQIPPHYIQQYNECIQPNYNVNNNNNNNNTDIIHNNKYGIKNINYVVVDQPNNNINFAYTKYECV